jgi:hypothetical protein
MGVEMSINYLSTLGSLERSGDYLFLPMLSSKRLVLKSAFFCALLLSVIMSVDTLKAGAVAGYNLSSGNSIFNRASSSQQTPVTPSERPQTTAILQALAKRSTQQKSEELRGTVDEAKDPLVQFCTSDIEQAVLQDADLVRDVALALNKNADFLTNLRAVRNALITQWEAWFNTENKTDSYAALLAAYEKELKKRKIVASDEVAAFARRTLLADYGNTDFTAQMIQSIRGSAYHSLLFFVIGYSPWETTNTAREVNGIRLTDHATLQRLFAEMVVAYRREYDAVFATACISTGLTFSRENKTQNDFFKESMKNEFLGASAQAEKPEFTQQLNTILATARAYAHKEAAAFMNEKLAKVTQLLTLFSARLEVARVADATFAYPIEQKALQAKLVDSAVLSILLGLAYRVSQQLLLHQEYIINSQQIQSFFVQEYQGQHRLNHISAEVLAGERFIKTTDDAEKKKRKAFEARCAVLFGDIDFLLQGAFEPDLQNALAEYDVARGATLYKKLMVVTCQRNGSQWGIVNEERRPSMLRASIAALKQLQSDMWAYMQTLGLQAADAQEMNTTYARLVTALDWKEAERAAFTTQSAVFFSAASRAKRGRVHCSREVYQALYKFFWLCIGARLLREVVLSTQAAGLTKSDEVEAAAVESVLAQQAQELARQKQSEATEDDGSLGGALVQAHKKLTSFGATMGSRVEQLKGNALRYASGQSDMRSVNTDILHSLDDSAQLLSGMQESIKAVFTKSDQASDRLVGSIKASLILVDRCIELCSKQMKTLRAGFFKFYTKVNSHPSIGSLMRKFIGGSIKGLLTDVNRDNEVPLARIKQALADMQLVLQGKKRSTELQI